jgi:hypothetical protein
MTAGGWQCSGTEALACTLDSSLAAGAEAALTLALTRSDDDCRRAQSMASVAALQYEAESGNDAASDTTLVGKPGAIGFASASQSAHEGSSPLLIDVQRSGGCLGDIAVSYSTEAGLAEPGIDFAAGDSFTIASGETAHQLAVEIIDDAEEEQTETFDVVLTSASNGGAVGTPSRTTVSLSDDDGTDAGAGALSSHWLLMLMVAALWSRTARWQLH